MVSDELHLANLPSDVIRKIIRIEQESIHYLRLISPKWNSLTLEHFTRRKNLPAIPWLHIVIGIRGNGILDIHLPERYLDYFGIRKRSFADGNEICNDSIEYFQKRGNLKPGVTLKLSNFVRRLAGRPVKNAENVVKFLAKILRRCSRIVTLTLTMDIIKFEDEFNIIKRALDGATVTDLRLESLSFNKKSANTIRDLLRAHPVKRLCVSAINSTLEADIFDTLERLYTDTMDLVKTGEFAMGARVGINEYLAIWDKKEDRERIRKAHASRKVYVNFYGIKKAGTIPEINFKSCDVE